MAQKNELFESMMRNLDVLNEEEFNVSKDELIDVEEDSMEGAEVEPIIDPDLDAYDDLSAVKAEDYIGKFVVVCSVCGNSFFNDTDALEGVSCPSCMSEDGELTVVGKICASDDAVETPAEDPEAVPAESDVTPVEPVDDDDEDKAKKESIQLDSKQVVTESAEGSVIPTKYAAYYEVSDASDDEKASVQEVLDNYNLEYVCSITAKEAYFDQFAKDAIELAIIARDENGVDAYYITGIEVCDLASPFDAAVNKPEWEYEDVKFNKLFSKFLTDSYKNVKSFKLTSSKIKENCLCLTGVALCEGKRLKIELTSAPITSLKEGKSIIRLGSPMFGRSKAFTVEHLIKENKMSPVRMSWRYRTRQANESYEVYGKASLTE